MSEKLHPSNTPVRAEDLPENWIQSVRSAVQRDGLILRAQPDSAQIEVYSERTKEWHALSPIFVDDTARQTVLAKITPRK